MKTRLELVDEVVRILRADEGVRCYAYDDATGMQVTAPVGKLTIGMGTNLAAGLDAHEVDWLCRNRLHKAWDRLAELLTDEPPPIFLAALPSPAQMALALMAYQLGPDGVMEFHRMLEAIREPDFRKASEEALASAWARETPTRAQRVRRLFREAGP